MSESRSERTLAILTRAVEQNCAVIDSSAGLRQMLFIIRIDKKTGHPLPAADFKPEIQTT